MAKSSSRNSSGSENTSGTRPSETLSQPATSRPSSSPNSQASNTATGSTIQRVSNPYTGNFSGNGDRPTPQAHQGGEGGFDAGYFGYNEAPPPAIDWSEYDRAEQAFQARERANALQRIENAAIEKENAANKAAYDAQVAANAVQEARNARTRDINASRLKKANDPGVVRQNFQQSKEHRTATTKVEVSNKRPHCMARPKRGKSGSGKGKGFVPFC